MAVARPGSGRHGGHAILGWERGLFGALDPAVAAEWLERYGRAVQGVSRTHGFLAWLHDPR